MLTGVPAAGYLTERLRQRLDASEAFFSQNGRAIAAAAAAMADRFFAGGTLLVVGTGRNASDAQHNAVEYLHPVLPGCRALPALALGNAGAAITTLDDPRPEERHARELRVLGRAGDIALVVASAPLGTAERSALIAARKMGMLTVALVVGGHGAAGAIPLQGGGGIAPSGLADHVLTVAESDPPLAQELHLATYHILWELVHIVLNHRGIPTRETT